MSAAVTGSAPAESAVEYDIRRATKALLDAVTDRTPCPPIRTLLPHLDLDAAYAIQQRLTEHELARGHVVVGHKVGLTSPAVQKQLGVDQPDFGVLFDHMCCTQGDPISTDRLLQPRIEAEIAFVLGADLDGDTRPDAVRAAVRHAQPAFEIVDSRIADWDIRLVDTVADNGSSALFVLGDDRIELGGRDLREVTMTMTDAAGTTVSSGTGADCLGDPLLALSWLASTVRDRGTPLRAGHVVLSGALGPMVAVTAGSTFTAALTGLGTVSVTFAEAHSAQPTSGHR